MCDEQAEPIPRRVPRRAYASTLASFAFGSAERPRQVACLKHRFFGVVLLGLLARGLASIDLVARPPFLTWRRPTAP